MRLISCLLITVLLSACGWHLRGVTPLPKEYRILHLQSQASNSVTDQLKLQLEFNQVLLTERAIDANAQLILEPVDIERRTLSVTSSGQINEFEINGRLSARIIHFVDQQEQNILVTSRRTFYQPSLELYKKLDKLGVLAVDMETAGLYGVAAEYGAKAMALFTVSDHVMTGEATPSEERQNSFNEMVKVALESV